MKWHKIASSRVMCEKVHKSASVWCKIALEEVSVSLPWWCHALVLLAPGYWSLFFKFKKFGYNGKIIHKVKLLKFQSFNGMYLQTWEKLQFEMDNFLMIGSFQQYQEINFAEGKINFHIKWQICFSFPNWYSLHFKFCQNI